MSVAIGMPHPRAVSPPPGDRQVDQGGRRHAADRRRGSGSVATRSFRSSPETTSRLISRPTTRKNSAIRPSLTRKCTSSSIAIERPRAAGDRCVEQRGRSSPSTVSSPTRARPPRRRTAATRPRSRSAGTPGAAARRASEPGGPSVTTRVGRPRPTWRSTGGVAGVTGSDIALPSADQSSRHPCRNGVIVLVTEPPCGRLGAMLAHR